jgi:hypothetical protein
VWQRFQHRDLPDLQKRSRAYLEAARDHAAPRLATAPERRPFPSDFVLDHQRPLAGTVVFLRRTNAQGLVECLGHKWPIDDMWIHRLVRIEIDLTGETVRIFRLRRREPADQPLIQNFAYRVVRKPFHE